MSDTDAVPMDDPGSILVTRYAQHLESKRLLGAALGISDLGARNISPLEKQAGVTYNGTLDRSGLSKFAHARPLQLVIERCNIQVRSALRQLGVKVPGKVFAGNFPLHSGLSSGSILHHAPHGSVILVDGHSLHLLAESVRLFCAYFIEPAKTDHDGLEQRFSGLLEQHVREIQQHRATYKSSVLFAPRPRSAVFVLAAGSYENFIHPETEAEEARRAIWTGIATACVRFVLGHEYGHLLDQSRPEGPTKGEAGELTADRWAARIVSQEVAEQPPGQGQAVQRPAFSLGAAWALFTPTVLSMAEAAIRAYAIMSNRTESMEAAAALLMRRHQSLVNELTAASGWRDEELAMAAEFDQTFRRLVAMALGDIRRRFTPPQA